MNYIDVVKKDKVELRKQPPKGVRSDIINFYDIIPEKFLDKAVNNNYKLHNIDLPFRMCVVEPSGSGKTNFLLNIIKVFSHGKGTFSDITIITSNKDEPLYNWLSTVSDNIKIVENITNTPKLDDMAKDENHLVVWDDLVLSKDMDNVKKYYMRARKKNCSVIFLSQSYYDIKLFIRKNCNYMVILDLGGSKREQTAILNEWGVDLDRDELGAIYNDAVSVELRPLIMKGGKCKRNEKYRKGWLDYYNLDEFLKNIPRTKPKQKRPKVYTDDDEE